MKVALLGYGTVGVGVRQMLLASPTLEAGPVLVRPGKADESWKVTAMEEILADGEVGAVVEVMGGVDAAYRYAKAALTAGRHFVTANKMLVAAHAPALAALAEEKGVAFLFGAACGGGVPFLHNLARAVGSGDDVTALGGILNGTCNYILDAMERRGQDFARALSGAQSLGYAEADPGADLSGLDALRKVVLGCAAAWGLLPTEGLLREGIESFTAADVAALAALGRRCRLMGRAEMQGGRLCALVEPTVCPAASPAAAVLENGNLAWYRAKSAGQITLLGQGAGRYPTASAVLRDLEGILEGERSMLPRGCRPCRAEGGLLRRRYYVRCPGSAAAALEAERHFEGEAGTARLLTAPMTPAAIHQWAAARRGAGEEIFFAAWEEEEC